MSRQHSIFLFLFLVASLFASGSYAQEQQSADTEQTIREATNGVAEEAVDDADEDGEDDDTKDEEEKDSELDNLLNADINQLANTPIVAPALEVPVTTVSRSETTIGKTPAAVFVITQEMIRRSGARSIPDALRLAPGVHVAKITSSQVAISIRGHTDRFANKLLVQIDGRSVYTPSFGGVLWDNQDMLLEDIERIEVIRGPGGTIWGENAVNGVINILTKHAKDTHGAFVESGGGTEERSFHSGRVGGGNGQTHWRVYGRQFERDAHRLATDNWRRAQAGFRVDHQMNDSDDVRVSGDIYTGKAGDFSLIPNPAGGILPLQEDSGIGGGNLLMNFHRQASETLRLVLTLLLRPYRASFEVLRRGPRHI